MYMLHLNFFFLLLLIFPSFLPLFVPRSPFHLHKAYLPVFYLLSFILLFLCTSSFSDKKNHVVFNLLYLIHFIQHYGLTVYPFDTLERALPLNFFCFLFKFYFEVESYEVPGAGLEVKTFFFLVLGIDLMTWHCQAGAYITKLNPQPLAALLFGVETCIKLPHRSSSCQVLTSDPVIGHFC